MLRPGDQLVVERKTGYSTYGKLVSENESGLMIESNLGSRPDLVFIRWENVDQIRVRNVQRPDS
jgi:hypothetical protein